jgi:hypothetical protein
MNVNLTFKLKANHFLNTSPAEGKIEDDDNDKVVKEGNEEEYCEDFLARMDEEDDGEGE